MQSSSQPLMTPARPQGGRLKRKVRRKVSQLSDVEEIAGSESEVEIELDSPSAEEDVMEVDAGPVVKSRKRRVVAGSDDDE